MRRASFQLATNSVGVQSEGEAEGGCGGNSASPEPKRSPAALLVQSRPTKKSFVHNFLFARADFFLLKEKQNLSLAERELASGGGAERQNSAFGFSLKKVRISFSVRSQIVCSAFVASAQSASARALWAIRPDFKRICHAPRGSKINSRSRKIRFAQVYLRFRESETANLFSRPFGRVAKR